MSIHTRPYYLNGIPPMLKCFIRFNPKGRIEQQNKKILCVNSYFQWLCWKRNRRVLTIGLKCFITGTKHAAHTDCRSLLTNSESICTNMEVYWIRKLLYYVACVSRAVLLCALPIVNVLPCCDHSNFSHAFYCFLQFVLFLSRIRTFTLL